MSRYKDDRRYGLLHLPRSIIPNPQTYRSLNDPTLSPATIAEERRCPPVVPSPASLVRAKKKKKPNSNHGGVRRRRRQRAGGGEEGRRGGRERGVRRWNYWAARSTPLSCPILLLRLPLTPYTPLTDMWAHPHAGPRWR